MSESYNYFGFKSTLYMFLSQCTICPFASKDLSAKITNIFPIFQTPDQKQFVTFLYTVSYTRWPENEAILLCVFNYWKIKPL